MKDFDAATIETRKKRKVFVAEQLQNKDLNIMAYRKVEYEEGNLYWMN